MNNDSRYLRLLMHISRLKAASVSLSDDTGDRLRVDFKASKICRTIPHAKTRHYVRDLSRYLHYHLKPNNCPHYRKHPLYTFSRMEKAHRVKFSVTINIATLIFLSLSRTIDLIRRKFVSPNGQSKQFVRVRHVMLDDVRRFE